MSFMGQSKGLAMKIKIQQYRSEDPVTVAIGFYEDKKFVIDWCNHANAERQLEDFGYPDRYKGDYIDDWHAILVCDRCGQYYDDLYGSWELS